MNNNLSRLTGFFLRTLIHTQLPTKATGSSLTHIRGFSRLEASCSETFNRPRFCPFSLTLHTDVQFVLGVLGHS